MTGQGGGDKAPFATDLRLGAAKIEFRKAIVTRCRLAYRKARFPRRQGVHFGKTPCEPAFSASPKPR